MGALWLEVEGGREAWQFFRELGACVALRVSPSLSLSLSLIRCPVARDMCLGSFDVCLRLHFCDDSGCSVVSTVVARFSLPLVSLRVGPCGVLIVLSSLPRFHASSSP